MAKKSMVNREHKRMKMVKKFAAKRTELKKKTVDLDLSPEERYEAQIALQRLPRHHRPR